MPLRRRFLLGVLPLLLCSLLAFGLFQFFVFHGRNLRAIDDQVRAFAGQAAAALGTFFDQRARDLDGLLESPLLVDHYKNRDYGLSEEADHTAREIERFFLKFAERTGAYPEIRLFDEEGRTVAAAAGGEAAPAGGGELRGLLEEVRASGGAASPILERDGRRVILLGKALRDDRGAFRGTVLLAADLSRLQEILAKTKVGREGRAYLVDASGERVLGDPPGFDEPLVQRRRVPGAPYEVVVAASPAELLGPVYRLRDLSFVFTAFVGLLVAFVLNRIVARTARPIEEMARGARRLAEGDLSHRFEVPAIEELAVLAGSFNEMAGSLAGRTRELLARVRELTALREMERAVIERMDEETILRTALAAVARGLSFDRTVLYWVDAEGKEIVGRYVYQTEQIGLYERNFQRRAVPLDSADILAEVVRTRRPALILNPREDPRLNPSFLEESKTREFVLAPILGHSRVFGVLAADNLYGGRPLGAADREGLTLFAHAVGIALENSALFGRLSESEARHRAVLQNSPAAILGLNREHRIATWNHGAETLFGWRAAEIVGKPLQALLPPGTEEDFRRLLSTVIEKGSVRHFPIAGWTKGGRRLELSLAWGGSSDDFWMNQEWTVVIDDVTEARALHAQLHRSDKLSAIGRLISGTAHELNNPLQAVIGYSQLLREKRGDDEEVRQIFESAMRCRRIIDNLLCYVRQGRVEKGIVPLDRAIRAALDFLGPRLRSAGPVEVAARLGPAPPVRGNFQQLQQVFVNLLTNACDAMAGPAGERRVFVRLLAQDGRARAEIEDSGPGIAPEHRAQLFEPLFTTKSEGMGTGLGLAICRQIVEDHGGAIGFQSEPGRGALFWVEVPAALPEAADEERGSPAASPGEPLAPVGGRSVLLVDDEKAVCGFLREVLEAEGMRVETAGSLREGLGRAAASAFDLVIGDVQLPDGNGLELFRSWGLASPRPRPAFLFLTGDALNESLERTFASEGIPHLLKPVDLAVFRGAVRGILAPQGPGKETAPAELTGDGPKDGATAKS